MMDDVMYSSYALGMCTVLPNLYLAVWQDTCTYAYANIHMNASSIVADHCFLFTSIHLQCPTTTRIYNYIYIHTPRRVYTYIHIDIYVYWTSRMSVTCIYIYIFICHETNTWIFYVCIYIQLYHTKLDVFNYLKLYLQINNCRTHVMFGNHRVISGRTVFILLWCVLGASDIPIIYAYLK